MLLILCVLPAGMSRSAWLAAGVSCLCVYAWHMDWTDKFRLLWQQQRQRVVMVVVGGFCVLLLAGYLLFVLKPDSARGRLFMWKITCRAIAEKPLTGYGIHNFAAAYGNAQETYLQQVIMNRGRNVWREVRNMHSMNICRLRSNWAFLWRYVYWLWSCCVCIGSP